jgi:hypothetical protein
MIARHTKQPTSLEFSDAITRAKDLSLCWWENMRAFHFLVVKLPSPMNRCGHE